MKQIKLAVKTLALIAVTLLAAGCTTEHQEKQNLAIAAGFKVITPVKPDQVALLPTLPKDKVTEITYQGKTFYVLPDVENNRAYVGGPEEYQTYQQLRLEKQMSTQNLQAAQMNQMASMNWGAWGGWGGYGWGRMGTPMMRPMGGYGYYRR